LMAACPAICLNCIWCKIRIRFEIETEELRH
jgi:hypothetical protein